MTTEIQEDKQPPAKRRRRGWKIFLVIFIFLLLLLALALFFSFNYFGERFLRTYLQEKVDKASNGLYHVDFSTFHVNLLTGKIEVDSFELIPDTLKYNQLKADGKAARSLYRISLKALIIDRVHFRQIYAGKRVNFRQLVVERPQISIVGFPDTATARHSRWRVIYEDLYPSVSGFFNDFHIDSIKVNHGLLLTNFGASTEKMISGTYEFSSILKDVSVNPFSYYNRERVFYSRDIDLVVHNFESQLADSLYQLKAEEIGFSLTRSRLYGKTVSLTPNMSSNKLKKIRQGDLFRIELPAFSISGVDLYRAITQREVEISKVSLTNLAIHLYRNQLTKEIVTHKKSKKKITLAGLYSVIAKELRFIAIDSLKLNEGSFEYYDTPHASTPELRIGNFGLDLNSFRLDSLTHLDRSRIFYARSIELGLERISLRLRDGIHSINASSIRFSTLRSLIEVKEAAIFPNKNKNQLSEEDRRNTMFVHLPGLLFTGIDLKKVFNRRILDFDRLVISEPEVRYTKFKAAKNPDPRFRNPEDFFESENNEVVYNLLKKYLWVVKGNEISITGGFIKVSSGMFGREVAIATSSFDLSMQQFLIDSVHGMNEQGYFYSRDFDLALQSVSINSPDSLKKLQADRVRIITADSLIEADNIRFVKSADPVLFNARLKRRSSQDFEFSLTKLQLTGLNHKKLFLEKILKANEIILDHPSVFVKTGNSIRPAGPPEQAQLMQAQEYIHTYEIGRCLVKKGAFSYDGEGDRKATYFSLKDIEFTLTDATVHVPESGQHDGLIKFDSLRLKVIPLRAVIADSTYALEARSLEVHSYPADITLQGVKITPLRKLTEIPGKRSLTTITIPEIRFRGFYFDRAIFDNQWLLEELSIDHPKVEMELIHSDTQKGDPVKFNPAGIIRFPPFMTTVAVRKITVNEANAVLQLHQPGKISSHSIDRVMIDVTRFRADSATRANPLAVPLFNADDITVLAPGFTWHTADSLYTFSFSRFGFSTAGSTAFLDSVKLIPRYDRNEFSVKAGHQTDRMVISLPGIKLAGIDFPVLLGEKQLSVRKISLEKLNFESYRDKRVTFPEWQHPLLPGRIPEKIRFPVCIDTIALSDGFASYEEQTGDEPGRIFFDQLSATLTGFCTVAYPLKNRHDMVVHGSTRLMGTAPLDSWIRFYNGNPRDSFSLRATIGELNLTGINPMLSRLMPVSVQEGKATSTEIFQLNANDSLAVGEMDFKYHSLAIRLKPTQTDTWSVVEAWLLTEVANLLLPGNPNSDGKMRHGVIYYQRDTSKGFFNYLWKSALSGVKSSVGVNSKNQKIIKKQKLRDESKNHR